MSSKTTRDKKSGYIYKLCKKLENQIDQEYDAEQQQTTIKLESDSDDEQEIIFSATTSDALLTSLKMTCSDSEDSSNEHPGISEMPRVFEIQSASTTKDSTIATVMNMFTSLSKQIATIHRTTDRVQREVTGIAERLGRVEKKMGISLATIEQVKDVILYHDEIPQKKRFNFNKITNEEEFTAFDSKLGTDKEYYENIKKELNSQIIAPDPDNRLLEVMDIIFDRTFMPQCSWTGQDIGSNKFHTISQIFLQNYFKNKLRHAKQRTNLQGLRKSVCRKRKANVAIAELAEKHAK